MLARSWDTTGLGGLTTADYATPLAADPFGGNSASFNPTTDTSGRFNLQAGYTFSYAPPPAGGQPITQTLHSVQSSETTKVGQGATYSYSVGINYGVSGSFFSFLNANLKTSETYTVTRRLEFQYFQWIYLRRLPCPSRVLLPRPTTPGQRISKCGETTYYGTYMFYPVQ